MRVLLLIVLFSLSTVSVIAQDSWPIVERCLGDLTYPIVRQGDWDFPGIIVSSIYPTGLHAIRGDMQVEYYIVYQSIHSFAPTGTLSPDGQYYAYLTGYILPGGTITEQRVFGEYLHIVRTDGNTDETYRFEIESYSSRLPTNENPNMPRPLWFGPDLIYYPSRWFGWNHYYDSSRITPLTILYHFRSGEGIYWTRSISPYDVSFVSPDGTRAFYPTPNALSRTLYDLENDTPLAYSATPKMRNHLVWEITWFADSFAFVVIDKVGLTIVDRDGNVLETIAFPNVMAVDVTPDGQTLALWNKKQNLFLVDRQQQTIYDLCIQFQSAGSGSRTRAYGLYDNLGWSPDSRSLAFSYDDYLVILDTQTWENQVIDHYSWRVMDWVPLPGESAD